MVFTENLDNSHERARLEEGTSAFKILTGSLAGKSPLERPRLTWENNIKMGLKEIGTNTRNRIVSAQDRDYWMTLVNAALNLRVLYAMELVSSILVSKSNGLWNVIE